MEQHELDWILTNGMPEVADLSQRDAMELARGCLVDPDWKSLPKVLFRLTVAYLLKAGFKVDLSRFSLDSNEKVPDALRLLSEQVKAMPPSKERTYVLLRIMAIQNHLRGGV